MIVKKYIASTEKEAILLAQAELGSNAVVLNVKNIKTRGFFGLFSKKKVEIMAALEEKDFASNLNEKKPEFKPVQNTTLDIKVDDKVKSYDTYQKPNAIEEKLDSLHTLLKEQMTAPEKTFAKVEKQELNEEKKNPNFKYLKLMYNKLIDNEVDEKYANMIIDEIEESMKSEASLDGIISAVYQKIILKLDEPRPIEYGQKPKIILFMGPTGVGKTTTIAKLASKAKLNEGRKVGFITADTYRIAAVEQLNTYADILGVNVCVVYTKDEIENAIKELNNCDTIFLDTAGRSHKDSKQKEDLRDIIDAIDTNKFDLEKYLCLSATTKYKDLINIVEAYKDIEDFKVLFTKLDETVCLGNIYNVKLYTGAFLSYTTSGQNVPDDIEVVNVQKLAKQLLGGNEG